MSKNLGCIALFLLVPLYSCAPLLKQVQQPPSECSMYSPDPSDNFIIWCTSGAEEKIDFKNRPEGGNWTSLFCGGEPYPSMLFVSKTDASSFICKLRDISFPVTLWCEKSLLGIKKFECRKVYSIEKLKSKNQTSKMIHHTTSTTTSSSFLSTTTTTTIMKKDAAYAFDHLHMILIIFLSISVTIIVVFACIICVFPRYSKTAGFAVVIPSKNKYIEVSSTKGDANEGLVIQTS